MVGKTNSSTFVQEFLQDVAISVYVAFGLCDTKLSDLVFHHEKESMSLRHRMAKAMPATAKE